MNSAELRKRLAGKDIRELSTVSGVSYSAIYSIVKGFTKNVRQDTVNRLTPYV